MQIQLTIAQLASAQTGRIVRLGADELHAREGKNGVWSYILVSDSWPVKREARNASLEDALFVLNASDEDYQTYQQEFIFGEL